jgi:hypothetical protein
MSKELKKLFRVELFLPGLDEDEAICELSLSELNSLKQKLSTYAADNELFAYSIDEEEPAALLPSLIQTLKWVEEKRSESLRFIKTLDDSDGEEWKS